MIATNIYPTYYSIKSFNHFRYYNLEIKKN